MFLLEEFFCAFNRHDITQFCFVLFFLWHAWAYIQCLRNYQYIKSEVQLFSSLFINSFVLLERLYTHDNIKVIQKTILDSSYWKSFSMLSTVMTLLFFSIFFFFLTRLSLHSVLMSGILLFGVDRWWESSSSFLS